MPLPITNLEIRSVESLRRMYMPFVTGGGLFIPGKGPLPVMGGEMFITLELPRLGVREAVIARVVWLQEHEEPAKTFGTRGFGVQFCDPANPLRGQLENVLAARLNDPAPTCTL